MIRTRFAPSPTGYMHIGNLRTILTSYLYAKSQNGDFVLRLEDTDQSRLVEGSVNDIINSLRWVGITWDEGVDVNKENGDLIERGDKGPYVQSKRLEIYKSYVNELVKNNKAYYCFCTQERLNEMRKKQLAEGRAPIYDRRCSDLAEKEIQERIESGEKFVVRMKIPKDQVIVFRDVIRGKMRFESNLIDDQVILKSDGFPTYHLAVVVDDHLMEISHVFRSEEWLPSTPKHILLYEALGFEKPTFGHLPQLLNMNGKKLSKRDGDVTVRDFRRKGYLPEAIINYIALLGWNPKTTEEIFSLKDLEERFDVDKLNKAGAKFDYKRLDWYGNYYIKRLHDEEYIGKLEKGGFLENEKISKEKARKIALIQKERISKLSDVFFEVEYLIDDLDGIDKDSLIWKEMSIDDVVKNLDKARKSIEKMNIDDFGLDRIQELLLIEAGEKRGEFLWPLRVALTNRKNSVSPFECVWVLGKEQTIERINFVLKKIG